MSNKHQAIRSRPALKYQIACSIIVACLLWHVTIIDSVSTRSYLPACISFAVFVLFITMTANDPELPKIYGKGDDNCDVLYITFATIREVAIHWFRIVANLLGHIVEWINDRDSHAQANFSQRVKAIAGFVLAASLVTVPVAWCFVAGSPILRVAVGIGSVLVILILDLAVGGFGWRPPVEGDGPGGLWKMKNYWPSITRNARTFLKGFVGGIANTSIYAFTVCMFSIIGHGLNEGRKSEMDRLNERQGIVMPTIPSEWKRSIPPVAAPTQNNPFHSLGSEAESEFDVDEFVGIMTAEYWRVAVVDLHAWRFPQPTAEESRNEFYERIESGLSAGIQKARMKGQLFVHEPLWEMANRHLETDSDFLGFMVEMRQTPSLEKQGNTLAVEAIESGVQTLEELGDGRITLSDVAEKYGVTAEIAQRLVSLEVKRIEQLSEIEQMQSELQKRFPDEHFALPE